ncbi:MAG TPA: LLM class F420-dependent oxidoreductase [Acidimicrobiia bacterium]|nr:LLM class F420-dependent oxidoreductase [Acidimicrobiia bacterium]
MKFGLMFVNAAAPGREAAIGLARAAEAAGFESLWTVEHVVVPKDYSSAYPYSRSGKMAGGDETFDSPDPIVWLAAIAGVTTTIRLATGILILPQRNPLILAKEVATLDVLSGGRVILGVGAGWLREEFEALAVSFDDRGDRLDEYIDVLRTVWTSDVARYRGRFVDFAELYSRPHPIQRPIPIVIGGHSRRAARRAGELGDGFFPASASSDELPGLVVAARRAAEDAGRDPASLEITMAARPGHEQVEVLAEAGVDRVLVPAYLGVDGLTQFATEVMPAFAE